MEYSPFEVMSIISLSQTHYVHIGKVGQTRLDGRKLPRHAIGRGYNGKCPEDVQRNNDVQALTKHLYSMNRDYRDLL